MSVEKNHAVLCDEAVSLLAQVEAAREHHGDSIPDDIARMLNKLEFMAENVAGEAGVVAALNGTSGQVPEALLPHRVLVGAFVGEYSLEIEHMRNDLGEPSHDLVRRINHR
jgi:hypothetical protein